MEGQVKVRRKLFFYKKRRLILMEDGIIFLVKHGHIKTEIVLDHNTKIELLKKDKLEITTKDINEIVECSEAEVWVNIFNSLKKTRTT
jgi:ribosome biogenesis protein Tsr3